MRLNSLLVDVKEFKLFYTRAIFTNVLVFFLFRGIRKEGDPLSEVLARFYYTRSHCGVQRTSHVLVYKDIKLAKDISHFMYMYLHVGSVHARHINLLILELSSVTVRAVAPYHDYYRWHF